MEPQTLVYGSILVSRQGVELPRNRDIWRIDNRRAYLRRCIY